MMFVSIQSDAMGPILNMAVEMLAAAKKPVLYLGGGCNSREAADQLRNFKKKYRLPAVTSLMGLGCIPSSDSDFA